MYVAWPLSHFLTVATLNLMANKDENRFDEDTDEAIVLPKPVPEVSNDGDDDEKKAADSAFDDLEIEVDEQELKAELENQPGDRKY